MPVPEPPRSATDPVADPELAADAPAVTQPGAPAEQSGQKSSQKSRKKTSKKPGKKSSQPPLQVITDLIAHLESQNLSPASPSLPPSLALTQLGRSPTPDDQATEITPTSLQNASPDPDPDGQSTPNAQLLPGITLTAEQQQALQNLEQFLAHRLCRNRQNHPAPSPADPPQKQLRQTAHRLHRPEQQSHESSRIHGRSLEPSGGLSHLLPPPGPPAQH
jgi:hypothetical protein